MERSFPNVFLLKARDPATASIALEARFEIKDRAELRALLDMPDDELGDGATIARTGSTPNANWH